jgi:putative alpha-1,2-mannosidase
MQDMKDMEASKCGDVQEKTVAGHKAFDTEVTAIPFNQTWLSHVELMKGGDLTFQMTSTPDYKWAVAPESRPPSGMSSLGVPKPSSQP